MQLRKLGYIFVSLMFPALLLGVDASNKVDVETDEAVIDFNNEQFSADGGVKFVYPNPDPEKTAKIKAFELGKVKDKNLILANNGVIFEQGENKVEAQEILFNLDDQSTRMRDGVSYVQVPGAPENNDRVYYGGEEFMAKYPDEAFVKNAWFTTSRKAFEMTEGRQNPGDVLPYHMKAKKIEVYPENKLVAHNTMLYIKNVPVLWLPWYATSLKSDTQAPLFPIFGSSGDDGDYVIWGFDYGHRDNHFVNGSIAIRKTQKQGFYIDSWENVYRINGNDNNKGKLTLEEALIIPKGIYEPEYKFVHEHEYEGKYGSFKWTYSDQTINTINEIDDKNDDYENGIIDENPYENVEKTLRRLDLETDLKGLGFNGDWSLKSNVQYISNREVVENLVGDKIEDGANDEELDNDIKTNIKGTKDNRKYRLYLHYDYLDDIDPGSTYADNQSSVDQKEVQLVFKKYKIDMHYNNRVEDEWRRLSDAERENGGTKLNKVDGWAKDSPYNPFTVKKYDKELEEMDLVLGPYGLFGTSFNLTSEWHNKVSEKTLNRLVDPFRKNLGITDREKEYHRNEDILYDKLENENFVFNLNQSSRNLRVELGMEKNTYIDRSDYDEGVIFNNQSTYNSVKVGDKNINLYKLGRLDITLGRREDKFVKGDKLYDYTLNLKHNINLYDNSGNYLRWADFKLDNSFGTYVEKYAHEQGDYSFDEEGILGVGEYDDLAYYRLNNKNEKLYCDNKISFDFGNTTSIYTYSLKNQFDGFDTGFQTDKDIINSLEFQIDKRRSIFLSHETQEDFLKNDKDSNSIYFGKYDEDRFRDRYYQKSILELADNTKVFKYQRIDSTKDIREKQYIDKDKTTGDYLGLSDRTITYGDKSTTENTLENIYQYEFGEKEKSWTKLNYSTWENTIYNYKKEENSTERYRDKYAIEYTLGNKKSHLIRASYENFEDVIEELNNEKKYTFRYEFKDETTPGEGEEEEVEFRDASGKYRLSMTAEELEELDRKFREERRKERGLGFDLMGLGDEDDDVIYKRYFTIYSEVITNEEYLKLSNDFGKSIKDYQIRGELHYDRLKLTYKYDQDIEFTKNSAEKHGIKRKVLDRTHEGTFLTRIGEPGYSWKLKGEITYRQEVEESERELDEWKISVGREFDFIELGIEYEEEWNKTYEEYDWVWRFRIALTTFPDKGLGVGAKYEAKEYSPEFEGGI